MEKFFIDSGSGQPPAGPFPGGYTHTQHHSGFRYDLPLGRNGAFLSSMFQDYLEEIRDGDQMIHYKHFTLFLGFNARSLALLKSFMRNELQRNETDFIVILSELDSRKLRESIMKELKEFHRNTEGTHELLILVRSGNPAEYGSLLMVNYKKADKVFIFNEDASTNTDFSVERKFFSLMRALIPDNVNRETALNAETKCDREIIVETSLKETVELIRRFRADNSEFCASKPLALIRS